MFFNRRICLRIKKNMSYVKKRGKNMSDSMRKFQELIQDVKAQKEATPEGTLRVFVHFLKGMKEIIQEAPPLERETIFKEFQKEQKEFESAMKQLQVSQDKLKDPEEMEKLRKQLEGGEFRTLIKQMSEYLFEIVKIMSEK